MNLYSIRNHFHALRTGSTPIARSIKWLVLDKVLLTGFGLLTNFYVIRELGPELFGTFSYCLAFIGLFAVIGSFGFERIVVQELVRRPAAARLIVSSALAVRLVTASIAVLLSTLTIAWVRGNDTRVLAVCLILSSAFLPGSLAILRCHFEARTEAKKIVLFTNFAVLLGMALRVFVISRGSSLVLLAWTYLVDAMLQAAAVWIAYRHDGQSLRPWTPAWSECRRLFVEGWPLAGSAIAIVIYTRIDQVMLGQLSTAREVGLYAAAAKISESWQFLPMAIITSVTPRLVAEQLRDKYTYLASTQKLYHWLLLLSLGMIFLVIVAAHYAVVPLLGTDYAGVVGIVSVYAWASIFVSLGAASARWLSVEGLQTYGLFRTIFGAALNVGLNFVLIPNFGGLGAAVATVISYGVAVFSVFFFGPSRPCGWMMLNSFNPNYEYKKAIARGET